MALHVIMVCGKEYKGNMGRAAVSGNGVASDGNETVSNGNG
jgi:hypothetical protein